MTTPSAAAVARIEAGLVDTCEIRHPDTQGAYDPDTNEQPTIPGATIYGPNVAPHNGACQFAEAGNMGRTVVRGGEAEIEHPYQISIPRTAPVPTVGLHLTLVAVHDESDASVIDATFVIRRVRYGTRMARRILLCDLLQAVTT